jgi:hypothetical protein
MITLAASLHATFVNDVMLLSIWMTMETPSLHLTYIPIMALSFSLSLFNKLNHLYAKCKMLSECELIGTLGG